MVIGGVELTWPDVVAVLGGVGVLCALRFMDWASRVDGSGRMTFTNGPARQLAVAAVASIALSIAAVVMRSQWLRWMRLATTVVTAVTAVIVALSRIAAANRAGAGTSAVVGAGQRFGTTVTSYGYGAAVGVAAALAMAVAALASVLAFQGVIQPG